MTQTTQDKEYIGFHKFRAETGAEFGSFEVFYEDGSDPLVKVGWYWWLCHKKCIAESDTTGPFPTAEGAYLDALEGGKFTKNEAGIPILFLDELRQFDPDTAEAEAEALDRDLHSDRPEFMGDGGWGH